MTFRYELWLTNDRGVRLALLSQASGFEYVVRVNGVGAFSVTLPHDFDTLLLGIASEKPDRRVEFWRGATNVRMSLETVGLIRNLRQRTNSEGVETLVVSGPDQGDLIRRRIVAYFAGTNEASKSAEADDVIKEFAAENFGASAADADRDWSGDGISIQGDLTLGPVVDSQVAWRNLLTVFDDVAERAYAEGARVYYAMVPVSPDSFELRTWTNQPGRDLSGKVVFSLERGNLDNPDLSYDYSQEATVVYSGGQGQGTGRMLAIIKDTTRINASVFNRRELFHDARNSDTLASVVSEGKARMAQSTPLLRFIGDVRSTPATRYGVDWKLGDRVTVSYKGQQFDSVINAVRVRVDGQAHETVTAKVENVTLSQVGALLVDTIQTPEAAAKRATTQGPTVTIA
jgi:hypothetical protein